MKNADDAPPPAQAELGHHRVLLDYFRTTSAAGMPDDAAFRNSTIALRRRLGSWLDVTGKDVLDLGSGTGELCGLALAAGARSVVGVNLSADEIRVASERVAAEFVCDDVARYLASLGADSIDRIFALNILEHLDKATLVNVLDLSTRVLRRGGTLVAMVPNATSPFGAMTRYWDFTHQQAFTPSSVRQLSRLAGFEGPEFRECGPVPHGVASGTRFVAWQGIRLMLRLYLMIEGGSDKGGIYTSDMLLRLTKDGSPPRPGQSGQ